jgi:hypothetical protein
MKMWIARDSYGGLYIYTNRPIRKEVCFNPATAYESVMGLPWNSFPEVTFENSPMEVELVLKK